MSFKGMNNCRRTRLEIVPAIRQAEAAVSRLKKGRIDVQVQLSQVSSHLASTQDRLTQADRALARHRVLLTQDRTIEIADTTYTPAQLRGMANRTISARKSLAAQAETLRGTHERLQGVVALLDRQEQDGRDRLDSLRRHLMEIDAKRLALKAVQEATRAVEDAGTLDFEALERQVRDLESKIEGELRFHEELLKQTAADSHSLESALGDTGASGELVAEIDKLLGTR